MAYQFFEHINNTCAVSGVACKGVWARNIDEARSGQGVCEDVKNHLEGNSLPALDEPPAEAELAEFFNEIDALAPIGETVVTSVDDVQLGTISEVLAFVDSGQLDPQVAIAAEKQGKNRATLIKQLEGRTDGE